MNPHFLIIFASSLTLLTHLSAQQAGIFDALEPLYPDSGADTGKTELVSTTPRSGIADAHILIDRLATNAEVQITCSDPTVQLSQLLAVPVNQNTGLHTRTELLDGKRNPYVIRRAPFHVYDAIRPLPDPKAKADSVGRLALRLEYPTTSTTKLGTRNVQLQLKSGKWTQTLTWNIQVHSATVPTNQPLYTNWFSIGNLARRHGHEPWSDAHWESIRQAAQVMRSHRQNTFLVPWRAFMQWRDNNIHVNTTRLDRYIKLFLSEGFTQAELGHIAHREHGDWNAKHLVTSLGNLRVDSDAGQSLLKKQLEIIHAILKRHSLEGKSLQHISDEPLTSHAADYVLVAKLIHTHLPGVPVFDATHATTELVGAVDVWCPQLDIYWKNHAFFQERMKQGEKVWIYTCLSPGGADLNRLLDQERTRCVLLSWLIARDKLDGYLHWGLNQFRRGQDPFLNSTPQFDNKPGPSRNFLPPGDTHVTYPDPTTQKLLPSVRLTAHRTGMEDAALLRQLQQKAPDKAHKIISQLIKSPKNYVLDVQSYRKARHALLTASVSEAR